MSRLCFVAAVLPVNFARGVVGHGAGLKLW